MMLMLILDWKIFKMKGVDVSKFLPKDAPYVVELISNSYRIIYATSADIDPILNESDASPGVNHFDGLGNLVNTDSGNGFSEDNFHSHVINMGNSNSKTLGLLVTLVEESVLSPGSEATISSLGLETPSQGVNGNTKAHLTAFLVVPVNQIENQTTTADTRLVGSLWSDNVDEEIEAEQPPSQPSEPNPSKYLKDAAETNDDFTVMLTKSQRKRMKKKAN